MEALKESNVSVHFTSLIKVRPDDPITAGGTSMKVKTLVCAIGFDNSDKHPSKFIGRVSSQEKFTINPDRY